jgi:hypothetical protein
MLAGVEGAVSEKADVDAYNEQIGTPAVWWGRGGDWLVVEVSRWIGID